MADIMFVVEPGAAPVTGRRRPRLVLRGLRRKSITKLSRSLKQILKDDLRETARGERYGYTPALFQGSANSPGANAIRRLITRCEEMLTERA